MSVYLAYVRGLRGPEPQLWHKDGNRFVVPSEVEVVMPPRPVPQFSSIEMAVRWHRQNPIDDIERAA